MDLYKNTIATQIDHSVKSLALTYCGDFDSLSHFFFHFSHVQPFWVALWNWATQQTDIQLANVELLEYMLGVPKDNPQAKVLNFIKLSCKFFIYRQKLYHEAKLDLDAFL